LGSGFRNTGLNHILGLVMPADRAATGNEPALRYGPVGLGGLAMTAFLSRLFRRPREDAPVWIEVGELQRRLAAGDAVVVVDVRQPEEFTAPPGHLPGAVNVPLADLSGRAGELAARREPVVLVCKTNNHIAYVEIRCDVGFHPKPTPALDTKCLIYPRAKEQRLVKTESTS
jgi:hypothetical protein